MRGLVTTCAVIAFASQLTLAQGAKDGIATKVSTLIEDTLVKGKATKAFADLERMGMEAAPYLVGHLDDFRPLPVQAISLVNKSPKAFEGLRHYGPKVVHDALSAILNQISGQHFEFVYNGASDAERRKNLEAWRSWCVSTFPQKVRICNGGV